MKIILYVILIAIVAAVIYGLYMRISNTDFSAISDSINNAFDNAAVWISDKVDEVSGLLGE